MEAAAAVFVAAKWVVVDATLTGTVVGGRGWGQQA